MAGMHSPLRIPVGRSSDYILHIYSCDYWVLRGSVSHVQSGRSQAFHSMMELMLAIQARMDEMGFPQSSTAPRSWQSSHPGADDHPFMADNGTMPADDTMPDAILASFLLRIQFRQNSSWQGTLVWVESKESCAFRSLLELLLLIAGALNSSPGLARTTATETEASLITVTKSHDDKISQA